MDTVGRSLALALIASLSFVSAGPIEQRQSDYGLVLYWGQGGTERSLADYCTSSEGVNTVVLAFLKQFGNGVYPNGAIDDCTINSDGGTSGCSTLVSDISTCQSNDVKVLISIGGADGDFSITGTQDAQDIASDLWNSYANPSVTSGSSPRPFGDVILDGWDFDIEQDPNSEASDYLGDVVNALRGYFSSDTSRTYYISGAPGCYTPVANMGNALMQAQFDWIWPQFYDGDCAAASYTDPSGDDPYGQGAYNLPDWPSYLSNGASANAKLYVGLPASTTAAGSKTAADSAFFYISPSQLPELLSYSSQTANYAGVMLWNAGQSDTSSTNGCNYAQEVRSVLNTGAAC